MFASHPQNLVEASAEAVVATTTKESPVMKITGIFSSLLTA